MLFSDRKYDRLQCLQKNWGLPQDDVYYAIENGLLRVCVWMPIRYMERGIIENKQFLFRQCETKEGFVGIREKDFFIISGTGSARLRSFNSTTQPGTFLRLPYEPRQPDVLVKTTDLLVLKEDRIAFESEFNLKPYNPTSFKPQPALTEFYASDDYRHISINGEEHHFGDVQAHIIETLHSASFSRKPWVHGKILLNGSGSRAERVRDLFKNKPDWHKVILSDKRGSYRLNLELQQQRIPGSMAA